MTLPPIFYPTSQYFTRDHHPPRLHRTRPLFLRPMFLLRALSPAVTRSSFFPVPSVPVRSVNGVSFGLRRRLRCPPILHALLTDNIRSIVTFAIHPTSDIILSTNVTGSNTTTPRICPVLHHQQTFISSDFPTVPSLTSAVTTYFHVGHKST
jgi:hypothetical protein